MPVTDAHHRPLQTPTAEQLAHEISVDCARALRRLDGLSRERYDVVLVHARQLIRHAGALSRAIETGARRPLSARPY
jgi:hypothetical protein